MTQATPQQDYRERVEKEKEQFSHQTAVHELPAIYYYWSDKYIIPKLRAFGLEGAQHMFESYLGRQCTRAGGRPSRFVSIGCGSGSMEIEIAKSLRTAGHSEFVLECVELNPALVAEGRANAEAQGVASFVEFLEADINQWQPQHSYDAAMACQSLHHVVNLEGLFDEICRALEPDGLFVVADMIGRNGHMRWPEAEEIVAEY